jgi:hypothetical protein
MEDMKLWKKHHDEICALKIQLVEAKCDLKYMTYEKESLERMVETLKELLDDEHKRRIERFK